MAVKTITVTQDAYEALKSLKDPQESFSEAILRIKRKRSMKDFIGILSNESAAELERTIKDMRRRHTATHQKRMQHLVTELERGH